MRKLSLEELNRPTIETFKNQQKYPAVLVLDNVRSLLNVGSAFRTADAFAIEKIYLCGITGTPPHREINKTALGATESVSWEHKTDTKELLLSLKKLGYQIAIVEQTDAPLLLQKFPVSANQKYVFLFGNEVEGVSDSVLPLGDLFLEIPQFGTKHSLNISVSIGIVLWHFLQPHLLS